MNDHVERMVQSWFERTEFESEKQQLAMHELINGIHRMIREAENEVRARCEEVAVQVAAGDEIGGRIALAIRTSDPESLPRKSLTEIYAPELLRQ